MSTLASGALPRSATSREEKKVLAATLIGTAIVFLGVAVGFIVISLFLPLVSLIQGLS